MEEWMENVPLYALSGWMEDVISTVSNALTIKV